MPAETVAMVHTATGGNPLYVTQSLAVLAVGPAAATDPDSARGWSGIGCGTSSGNTCGGCRATCKSCWRLPRWSAAT